MSGCFWLAVVEHGPASLVLWRSFEGRTVPGRRGTAQITKWFLYDAAQERGEVRKQADNQAYSRTVHRDRLIVRLKRAYAEEAPDCPDDKSLTIPWQKPPSKRSRQILLPHNASRSDVRPEQFERSTV